MRLTALITAAGLFLALSASVGIAGEEEWVHRHSNYPRKPYGKRQIRDVFGRPCGRKVNDNQIRWRAWDTKIRHHVNFHRKLGGATSSNLDYDIRGHIRHRHKRRFVRSGIGSYNCRVISGTNKWSTHAWGIAVDVSWNYEHYGHNGHPCHVLKKRTRVPRIWQKHGWTWGRYFPRRDCMHFQYASGY